MTMCRFKSCSGHKSNARPQGRAFAFGLTRRNLVVLFTPMLFIGVYPDVVCRGLPRLVPMSWIGTRLVGACPDVFYRGSGHSKQGEPKYHLLRSVL